MWSPNVAGWERTERERLFTAIFAESCVASSEALLALLTTLHRRRPTEWAHAQRVASIAMQIGRELALPERLLLDLERASWLHDLGKMVVSDRTSSVSEVVQPADVAIWSRQLFAAGAIIEAAPALKPAAAFVLASRECVDGTGFPHRLVGEDIPLGARIVHVADTYDALTELCAVFSVSSDSINAELTRHVGTRFDASVVAAWLRCADGAPTPSSARSGDDAGSLF